jgi:hypothetical protein
MLPKSQKQFLKQKQNQRSTVLNNINKRRRVAIRRNENRPNIGGSHKVVNQKRVGFSPYSPPPLRHPDAMVVEGGGTASINGVYLRDGDSGRLPRYTINGGTTDDDSISGDDGVLTGAPPQWNIWGTAIPFPKNHYGAIIDVATPDLVPTWEVVDGDAPAPTVRRANWEDIDAEGIDHNIVPIL